MRRLTRHGVLATLLTLALPALAQSGESVAAKSEVPREVQVVGRRHQPAPGFSAAEVKYLPGGLGDPIRAIEPLPGVTPTLSGVPYFFVRGAPPGNLGYFFDGTRLPALFHALGGPSVIHPGLVDSVQLYAGPYPIEYGGFAAGIVAARAAEPAAEPRGEVAIKATDSSGLVDAPLDDASSLTLAGRYSYANPVLHLFAEEMSVAYWDYQARIDRRLSASSRASLRVFGAHDALTDLHERRTRTLYGVDFHRADLRAQHRFDKASLALQALGGWDRSFARDGQVQVRDASAVLRLDWTYDFSRSLLLRSGLRLAVDEYALELSQLDDPQSAADYRRLYPPRLDMVAGGYAGLEVEAGSAVTVRPGVRVDVYGSRGAHAVGFDPRVSAEYRVSGILSLHTGLGVAHQPPASAVPSPGLNPALGQGLQTGVQHSYGFRLRLPEQISLEATLYQTALFRLFDSIGQARARDADGALTEDSRGTGVSRGLELLLKRSLTRKLGGFVSYTLSSSRRFIGRVSAPSAYDRRHVLSAALGYDWGRGFRSGVRSSLYTGIPADVAYLQAMRDPPRTSPYFRLDLRSEKRFVWGSSGWLAIVLEVVNATLNQETLRASCSAYGCEEQRVGPITIPNLGIEAGF